MKSKIPEILLPGETPKYLKIQYADDDNHHDQSNEISNGGIMKNFRSLASFGKRIEFWVIGEMIKQGLDVYIPVVDDMGIDAVVRKEDGSFLEIQIKARSKDVVFGNSGLFAAINHDKIRKNYYFVFYSERMGTTWIMSSKEFIEGSSANKKGKNPGKRTIWLNGKNTKENKEFTKKKFEKYIALDFGKLK